MAAGGRGEKWTERGTDSSEDLPPPRPTVWSCNGRRGSRKRDPAARVSRADRSPPFGLYTGSVDLSIELDREDDGRWIAEALELPGVMTYGSTREEAISNTEKLAIEVIADRITHGELPRSALSVSFRVLSEQLAGD